MNLRELEMARRILLTTCSMLFFAGPAFAAGDCAELCDASFYATATVADVKAILESGVDVNIGR